MDSIAVSIYENIYTPDSVSTLRVYRKLSDLLNVNTDREVRIFCPLCVSSFSFKFYLFEHLRTFHYSFLTQVHKQALQFKECPFCNAKFYGNHLTAKHILNHHPKVTQRLFVNRFKCFFCKEKLNKEDHDSALKHIEDFHFLPFEEHLREMFLCDTVQEMSMSEFVNSPLENSKPVNWEDVCVNLKKHSEAASEVKDFDEASRINCYDFTDLKQQLDKITDVTNSVSSTVQRPILKDAKNTCTAQKSARRVLRFDLPFDSDNKENIIPKKNFNMSKQINLEECSLLSHDKNPWLCFKSNETFCEEPKYSSTPNFKCAKILSNECTSNMVYYKSRFKSFINEKNKNGFGFQCGKCRLLFKENCELVSHVKNNHKKFSLNPFQPCYHCAICSARFYKNRYLRKHHSLHKPY